LNLSFERQKQQAMNFSHFRDYSFTDYQTDCLRSKQGSHEATTNFHGSLCDYYWTNHIIGLYYGNTSDFYKCIFIRDNIPAVLALSSFHISDVDTCDYNGRFCIDKITSFIQTMQSFYLQHEDLFNQMVKDYAGIHETVHLEMQKVYDAIIDGVYNKTTPVIK
jgi:hypothetical protein